MYHCGDIIDQYRLKNVLGAGSYGKVFEAENVVSKQNCALKVIPLCGRAGERELRALQQYHNLEHPNLLKVHHSGINGDYLYYTMDLADGKLADQHLTPAQLRSAATKIADALATMHEHGLLHRDLKPDNLFFLNGEPLIGDIGLVTADSGASLTGTPGFLPLSVRKGAALSNRSDLYALAKSFYCLLSGNPPADYPKYAGPVDPDASVLLQAVLDVCDENGAITSAAEFRDFLQIVRQPKRYRHIRLFYWGIAVLILAVLAFLIIYFKPFTPLSPGQRMFSAVQKAERLTSAEQTAIGNQEKVYANLKKEAKRKTDQRYPRTGKTTSFNYELRRETFYDEELDRLIRVQSKKSPEFHCFYILWNEQKQASLALYNLSDHPEYANILEKDFQLWQKKYAAYCKQRDSLLK